MGRKFRKKQDFGKKDIQDDIGTAYEKTVLINPDREDCIYDDFELESKNQDDKLAKHASKKLYRKTGKKEAVLSLNLDSSDDEGKPKKRKKKKSQRKVESSDDDEDLDAAAKDSDNEEWSLEKDFLKKGKDMDVDTRAWGTDRSVYFSSNVTDNMSRKRASNLHVDENYEALQLELEGQQDFQNKMKEGAKMDMRSILFEDSDEEEPEEKISQPTPRISKEQKARLLRENWPDVEALLAKAEEVYYGKDGRDIYLELLKNKHLFKGRHKQFIKWCIEKHRVYTHFYYYVDLYLIFIDSPHEISPEQIREHPLMDKIAHFKNCIMFLEQFDECFVPQVLAFNASVRAGQPLEVRSDSEEEETETDQAKSDDNNNEEYDWKLPVPTTEVPDVSDADSCEEGEARRPIGKKIMQNKGLIVERSKKTKIPRTKYRARFEKKKKQRKGQVQEIRKLTAAYTGEASGINIKAVKSRKFK